MSKISKEEKQLIKDHMLKMRGHNLEWDIAAQQTRAQAFSVGTSFGGTTDIMMRKFDGTVTWAILQPAEVVELIHQLSANIGCHVALKPRDDFASWRGWRNTKGSDISSNHDESFTRLAQIGRLAPPVPLSQQPKVTSRSNSNEQTVADQKPVKRSRAKRAATPT